MPHPVFDVWYRIRDRLVGDPAFQRAAARFAPTRPIARRRARALFDLVSGFVYSQVLSVLVKRDVFAFLAAGPRSRDEITARLAMPQASADRVIAAGVALRLLNRRMGGRIGLGDLGAALVANPGVSAMVVHHDLLYRDLGDPIGLLEDPARPTELGRFWGYVDAGRRAALSAEEVAAYSTLMGVSQQFIATEVLDAYDVRPHRRLLDIGGGQGAFAIAAAARSASLDVTVFDLPAVAERAAAAFGTAGLSGRARALGGDLYADDPLPATADLVTLVRVLYDHPREKAAHILRKARAALEPGGTLLIAEPMAEAPGAETVGAAYFGFYLLAMKGGEARAPGELVRLATEAGFEAAKPVATANPLLTGLICAKG